MAKVIDTIITKNLLPQIKLKQAGGDETNEAKLSAMMEENSE